MRILHIADFHADAGWMAWALAAAPGFGAVCFAGDAIHECDEGQAPVARRWLASVARAAPVIACSGNHDLPSVFPPASPRLVPPGHSAPVGGALFTSIPWAEADDPHGLSLLLACWETGARHAAACRLPWVVVCHDPPEGAPFEFGLGQTMCSAEMIARYRPRLFLCGHEHRAPTGHFRIGPTQCLCPGRAAPGAAEPARFEIDLAPDGSARWSRVTGLI